MEDGLHSPFDGRWGRRGVVAAVWPVCGQKRGKTRHRHHEGQPGPLRLSTDLARQPGFLFAGGP